MTSEPGHPRRDPSTVRHGTIGAKLGPLGPVPFHHSVNPQVACLSTKTTLSFALARQKAAKFRIASREPDKIKQRPKHPHRIVPNDDGHCVCIPPPQVPLPKEPLACLGASDGGTGAIGTFARRPTPTSGLLVGMMTNCFHVGFPPCPA